MTRRPTNGLLAVLGCLAACGVSRSDGGAVTEGGITMLVRPGGDESPAALFEGTLGEAGGCVAFVDGRRPVYLLFPPGFELHVSDGAFEVEGDGHVMSSGDRVGLGGGLLGPGSAEELTRNSIPDACLVGGESYAFVGEVVSAPA